MSSLSKQLNRSKNRILKTRKKRQPKYRLVKYFTKELFQEAARNADKWDYNRQLDLEAINTLPDGRFPVSDNFPHYHRHFEPAEEHMRAFVMTDAEGGIVAVDMPLDFWERLPEGRLSA
jgi:hypothetical protein